MSKEQLAILNRAQGIREALAILDVTRRQLGGTSQHDAKATLVLVAALIEAWAVEVEKPIRALPVAVEENRQAHD